MPVRLISTTFFQVSYGRSSIGVAGAPMPALLNSTSQRPKVSLVLANSALTEAGSLTSVGTTRLCPLVLTPSAAVSSSLSCRRPASATANPSFISASATALPMPVPAPVTTAILFCAMSQFL